MHCINTAVEESVENISQVADNDNMKKEILGAKHVLGDLVKSEDSEINVGIKQKCRKINHCLENFKRISIVMDLILLSMHWSNIPAKTFISNQ